MKDEMKYDIDTLAGQAKALGFDHAAPLNTDALTFMPEVRGMCEANRCAQYGKNWTCPPGCGSLEEAAEKAKAYSFGMLVQTVGAMEDEFDLEAIEATGQRHKENFLRLAGAVRAEHPDALLMGAGGCRLCETCTYPDAPCRFPDRAIPSMEAYGLWVSKVCELSGVPYYHGPLTLTYTSCYLLK